MSTKCFTCAEVISNGDFVKCAEKFNSKCVALNKTTLNAIASCPNIHWLCHECNNGYKMIGTSIDELSIAVSNLKNSFTGELLAGFKLLTETLPSTLSTNNRDINSSKKRRETKQVMNPSQRRRSKIRKKGHTATSNVTSNRLFTISKSNETMRTMTAMSETRKRKSVVISNIDMNISPEYLCNYLSNELGVDVTQTDSRGDTIINGNTDNTTTYCDTELATTSYRAEYARDDECRQ